MENKDGDKFVESKPPVIGQTYTEQGTPYIPGHNPNCIHMVPTRPDHILDRVAQEHKEEEIKIQNALDIQIGGDHYKNYKIQPIEYSMANNLNPCQANVVKYITRYKDKNGLDDLNKAKHYIDLLIQMEYQDDNSKGLPT
jgi:hypothetical protein